MALRVSPDLTTYTLPPPEAGVVGVDFAGADGLGAAGAGVEPVSLIFCPG